MAASDFEGTSVVRTSDNAMNVIAGDEIDMIVTEGSGRRVEIWRNGVLKTAGDGTVSIDDRSAQLRARLSTFDLLLTVNRQGGYRVDTFGGDGEDGCCGIVDPPGVRRPRS